jgi:transcriptional regulator NrdR family protein
MAQHIIKRRGHREAYDEKKIYASVYAASLNAHLVKVEAEKIAERVSRAITSWIALRETASSGDIFKEAIKLLKKENTDVAFMYETHRDLA